MPAKSAAEKLGIIKICRRGRRKRAVHLAVTHELARLVFERGSTWPSGVAVKGNGNTLGQLRCEQKRHGDLTTPRESRESNLARAISSFSYQLAMLGCARRKTVQKRRVGAR